MQVTVEELSKPVKITIVEEADVITKLKQEIFEQSKSKLPAIKGFRQGTAPKEIAEKHFGVENLYKKIIDDLYLKAVEEHNVVSGKDFKIYGEFKDGNQLVIEFVAELKPTVELANIETLSIKKEIPEATEKDVDDAVKLDLTRAAKFEDIESDGLKNYDVAVMDYEGTLEGEKKPFNGGSAKEYRLEIDLANKKFVDTFEDQLIGMKIGEERKIQVTFPIDYRDKTKAGKKACFIVKLNAIKKKIEAILNDDFAKLKGFNDLHEYKNNIRGRIVNNKTNQIEDEFKRDIMKQLILNSKISPVPVEMFEREFDKHWNAFLNRIGKNEKEYLKEQKSGKEYYRVNQTPYILEMIKADLVLEATCNVHKIEASKDDCVVYINNCSKTFNYDEDRKQALIKGLENEKQLKFIQKSALNEKAVKFLTEFFNDKNK
jgi:trigger factor